MGGKTQLYKRSSLVFFFLGVVALGLQISGVMLPFWLEDDWFPAAQQSLGRNNSASFRVFQGLWTDYKCLEGYREAVWESPVPEAQMPATEGDLSYRDCSIRLMASYEGQEGIGV